MKYKAGIFNMQDIKRQTNGRMVAGYQKFPQHMQNQIDQKKIW